MKTHDRPTSTIEAATPAMPSADGTKHGPTQLTEREAETVAAAGGLSGGVIPRRPQRRR